MRDKGPSHDEEKLRGGATRLAVAVAIPTVFAVCALVGVFLGKFADDRLGTDPYLTMVGALLGVGAGFVELFRMLRQSTFKK